MSKVYYMYRMILYKLYGNKQSERKNIKRICSNIKCYSCHYAL